MSFYNQFLEHFTLPLGDRILGSVFMKELSKLREIDLLNEIQLVQLQEEKLSALLDFAIKKSPYYQKMGVQKEADAKKFLKKFPILTKENVREHSKSLLTRPQKGLIVQRSSGSSGLQTTVYFNKQEQSIQQAQQIRWWEWAGYQMGDPLLQTGITPDRGKVKKIKDFLLRTYYLQAFTHSEEEIVDALQWVSKQHDPVLAGYASSLNVIAEIASKNGIDIQFKTAISWGDKLFDHYRKNIVDTFHCEMHDTYASSEGFMIAAQKDLKYLYIMTPQVYVEIIDENGNEVPDGTLGHVVVTHLNNFSMPLIRYRIGDLAIKLPKEKYPPNREMSYPLFEKIIGRDTDLVKTRSGKYMVVHSFTGIIEHYPAIKQYTVIQRDLDSIEIQYIPDKGFHDSILTEIKKQILDHLQEDHFTIRFSKVTHIPPTASGKPQIIQSYLKKNETSS